MPASSALLAVLLASGAAGASFAQRVGDSLPLEERFRDGDAPETPLASFLGRRPAVLLPVYFSCPGVCPLALEGLVKALRPLRLEAGRDFEVLVYSFDPGDAPAEAARRRRALVEDYRRPGRDAGWHVLTGRPRAVRALDESLGLRPRRDGAAFEHIPGLVVVTARGRIVRYFFGVDYSARDLGRALERAGEGRLGAIVDAALLLCFRYDPRAAPHTAAVLGLLRGLAAASAAALAAFVVRSLRRERRA